MDILLIFQRSLFPYRKAHTPGGDIHEQEIHAERITHGPVHLTNPVLQQKMLEINFLRHIHHVHFKACMHPDEIQNGTAVLRFTENRRGIYGVFLHPVILQKLLQPVQHAAQPADGGEGQFLLHENFFAEGDSLLTSSMTLISSMLRYSTIRIDNADEPMWMIP